MSNYPPGVTGNEYAIAGPDTEVEGKIPCPTCAGLGWSDDDDTPVDVMIYSYGHQRWAICERGSHEIEIEDAESPWDDW